VAIVVGAMQDGTWSRLKPCRNHGCRWLFYDHSTNRSGTWCTMAGPPVRPEAALGRPAYVT
jgi:predicted RNA-binding Zn ribbon-like protein